MNNVNPPSSFTANILLHTYTQERSQSSAESAFTGVGEERGIFQVVLGKDTAHDMLLAAG
jgi:hypothetical protein